MKDIRRLAYATMWIGIALACAAPLYAQTPEEADERNIRDLVTASHILANEGVLDSFGHASIRSVKNPNRYFIPLATAPGLVTRADIVEIDGSCEPVTRKDAKLNGERFIHCEVYKARPDVQAVIHTHDPAVLPFPLAGVPLRPLLAQSGFLPPETPVFDVRDVPLKEKGMLILNPTLGQGLAKSLGNNPVVLMRGHGDTVVGSSIRETTVRAIYTDINARAQLAAMALNGGKLVVLNAQEIAVYDKEQKPDRPWANFLQRLIDAKGKE